MRRRVLLVGLLLVGVIGGAVGPVAATHQSDDLTPVAPDGEEQSHNESESGRSDGESGAHSETTASTTNQSETPADVVERVDSRLRVVSYEFHREQNKVTIVLWNNGERPSDVTVTEAISRDAAQSGRFGIKSFEVDPGERVKITLRTYTERPLGVMVTTQLSVEQGHGTFLPFQSGVDLFSGPATWADVRAGAFSGFAGTLVVFVIVAWHHRSRNDNDVEDVSLEVGD